MVIFSSLYDALDSLDARVILFGGKGGVGKTTLASAAAIHLAQSRKVILFTTDPASSLRDVFDHRDTENLRIEELDAEALWKRFLDTNLEAFIELGDRGTYLDRDELRRFFELSVPGIDELMAWQHIGELAETNEDATIVVDTAPTGHTLRMLGSAGHFEQLARALDALQAKHRTLVQQLTRRDVRDAMDAFIEKFDADATRRRELLRRGAFIPVTLSEPWVVEQTKRLIDEVRAEGLDVPFVVLNRAAPLDDCARCRAQRTRDEAAQVHFERVVIVPRSCEPLFEPQRHRELGASVVSSPLDVHSRLTFFAGKGGVGKTTCSTSFALQLAKSRPGEKFTILSVDPAHSLRDVFASEAPPPNLAVETIDTRSKWRDFRASLGVEIDRAVDAITPSGLSVAYDADAMKELIELAPPGADELFAISRIADLIADASIAGIVVDTAPTGHFLRLLELPDAAGEWVREFMRILLRYRELVPSGSLGEELLRAARALHLLTATLQSESASVVVVTRPERIVIDETERLIEELRRRNIRIGGVIANYVTPESDCACDRSMRRYELSVPLWSSITVVERKDHPVTRLDDIASLIDLH